MPHPHGPIVELAPELRVVEGEIPPLPFTRRMSIIRLADGRLVFSDAVLLADDAMRAIEAWGTPAFVVVPGNQHTVDVPAFKERWPHIVPVAARADAATIDAKLARRGLGPTADLSALPTGDVLTYETLDGGRAGETAYFVRHAVGGTTMIVNDILFNLTRPVPGFHGFMLRLMGSWGGLKVTPVGRWYGVADRRRMADHFERIAARGDIVRIVMAHGEIYDDDPAAGLMRAAARLRG